MAPLSPNLLSVLPLIYVGWSDSVLSPSEMQLIHKKIEEFEFLSAEEKAYLIHWSDPKNPPSHEQFKFWTQSIKRASKDLSSDQKTNLIQLGTEIAKSGTRIPNDGTLDIPKTRKGLLDLHKSLALNAGSDQAFLKKINPSRDQPSSTAPAFDEAKLQLFLDGEKHDIKERLRKLLRDPFFQNDVHYDKDTYRNRVLEQVKALAKQGLSAYSFPKKYGGYERKTDHIAIFEMLGFGDLSLAIKFGVQFGLFGGAVHQLGTEKHHKKYVEALHKAELLGCFAMTETGHGSNVKNLETTASYDHSKREIVIHSPNFQSGKEYIGNALHSSMAAVFAQLIVDGKSHGVHCILVPIRNQNNELLAGIKVEDCGYKLGLNGVDNGRLWFDQVRVPVDNLLNRYGSINEAGQYSSPIENPSKRFFTMLGALVVGRICVGLLGVKAAQKSLAIALKYATKRRQFSSKDEHPETIIMDYPSHQKRLLPQLANNYGYYFALQDLAGQYVDASEDEVREIETLAAGLKAKATWHATETIQICREACGGKGYLAENQFSRLKADSDIFTTFEGDNTVLMQLVAKGLLTKFKQSFHDDGYMAVMRFLYTKLKHDVYEMNPVQKRSTDAEHLLSKEFHMHAFEYRKTKTLITLSERMRKYLKRGKDTHQAFLKVQNHMIDLAHAYIDQVVLESFYSNVEKCEDDGCRSALIQLVQLYALETMQSNKGWFLESDYMDGAKTKAIRRMVQKLYDSIRPNVLGYTAGFGIPEDLLAAPIAVHEFS